MGELLELDGVVTGYGHAPVLHGVSLGVQERELAVILGPNGVGKSTLLQVAAGMLHAWKGAIRFDGKRIDNRRPDRIVREGVAVVPEPPGVFGNLSVLDNLRVGGFALGAGPRAVEQRIEELFDAFPRLHQRSAQSAGSLSGGERRVLALARALMGMPRLLLVDEASMGLFPTMISEVMEILGRLRDEGMTVCMVEQNVSALSVANRAYVMQKGRIVHSASGDLRGVHEQVASAYLGARGLAGAS